MLFGTQKPKPQPGGMLQLAGAPVGQTQYDPMPPPMQSGMQHMIAPQAAPAPQQAPVSPQGFAQGMMGAQAAMAPQPHKSGVNWLGVLADTLAGAAGKEGPYMAAMKDKQRQQEAAQEAAAQRAASMQDWQSKYQYESDHPKPTAPGEFERSLQASGINPGTPEWAKANADRVQHWNDPMVNVTLPNGQVYSGPQSGLQSVLSGGGHGASDDWGPVVDHKPGGVSGYSAGGGFPKVNGNGLDAITVNSESSGNPNAVSPKGARGLWQVMPSTARDPGFGIKPSNGSQSDDARVGSEYRRAMQGRYGGSLPMMWAAYNAGPGAVDLARARHGEGWLAHMPAETQAYVNKNMQMVRGR